MNRRVRVLVHEIEALAFLLALPFLFLFALAAEIVLACSHRTDDPGFPTEDPLGLMTPPEEPPTP